MTDVTRIAVDTARQLSPRLRVVGVTLGAREGAYTEVIIDITEGPFGYTRMSLGVFRNTTESVLRDEITDQLQRRLQESGS